MKMHNIAIIDEAVCIGCGKCLPACPVDAIIGAPKYLHTIIQDECTGCGLCIAPCPVDCISLKNTPLPDKNWRMERAVHTKTRVEAKAYRKTATYYAKRPEAAALDRALTASTTPVMDRKAELAAVMMRRNLHE